MAAGREKRSERNGEALTHDLMYYNDIYVKSNDLSHVTGPTVIAVAHNEMYFLPAWLAHYRRLGTERFIILDDASTDDTLPYLKAQPDVMVVGSQRRFGETVAVIDRSDPSGQTVKHRRMPHIWRMLLPECFSVDRWVVQVALDEFLVLPEGKRLPELFAELEGAEFDCVLGRMLDTYPRDITALKRLQAEPHLDLSSEWYFDAAPPRRTDSRARLIHTYLTVPALPFRKRLPQQLWSLSADLLGRYRYIREVNNSRKVPIVRWRTGAWMKNVHSPGVRASRHHHIPILHMKFTGDLYRRAREAIRTGSYHNGSAFYRQLLDLLQEMERRDASFLCRNSAPIADMDAYRRAGLLVGF